MISHAPRCSGVACSRRGNHASGMPSVRPSVRSIHILSSSNRTDLAEIFIPNSLDEEAVLLDQTLQRAKRPSVKPLIDSQRDRLQPKFRLVAASDDVDVMRLA